MNPSTEAGAALARRGRGLPGPKGQWLLGATEAMRDWLGCISTWPLRYGDIYRFRVGLTRIVHVSSPALVEEVCFGKARFFRKGALERQSRVAARNGLLISEGDFWKRQRRLMSPPFSPRAVAAYGDIMVASADAVSGDWRPGEKRDVFRDTARIASGVVAKSLFGADVQGMAEHLGEAVAVFMDGLRIRGESLISFPLWVPTPTNRRLRRAIAILDRVIYGFITERRAAPSSTETSARPDLLSLLLAARDDDGSGMTDAQLRDEVMTIFVAGFETTSVAMAAALFYLAAHPEVQARVRQEIRAVLGTRAPTVVDLPALGLIERVAKEALRLFPPAFCFDRDVIEPVELGGHTLEPGTLVLMAPYFTQRDPRYWKGPEAFDPDRWLDPATKALPKGIYLPFGLGPRICIGAAFAMQELVLVLARLCQRFAFVEVPGAPLVGDPGFTLRPKGGVMLEIRAEGP